MSTTGLVRENCQECDSALFIVMYDPIAQGRHIECADCGHVIGGLK